MAYLQLIKSFAIVGIMLGFVSLLAMFFIWWERKVAGWVQSRMGPTHVGWFGLLQPVADGMKLLFKEDLLPRGADAFLFKVAPYIAFAPVFVAFMALPFGPNLVFEEHLSIGILYILAVLSVEVMGVILAGWSSNSKYSVYGAMRVACQMVSYEIPMGLCVVTAVLTAGTLHMAELSRMQADGLTWWLVFRNPFMMLAFVVFFVSSLAANKRAPFDLPESESELVAGFHTEYSALRFSFFFFAEYAGMFVVGGIIATLFLGGWNSPMGNLDPILNLTGYTPSAVTAAYRAHELLNPPDWQLLPMNFVASKVGVPVETPADWHNGLGYHEPIWKNLLFNVYCFAWFVGKALAIVFMQIWIRWTLPRIRIDQVMHACVKVLLPMSLVALIGSAAWICLFEPSDWTHQFSDGEGPLQLHAFHDSWREPHSPLVGLDSVQSVTQNVLALFGVMTVAHFVWIAASAYRKTQPTKSMFGMKVGAGETFEVK